MNAAGRAWNPPDRQQLLWRLKVILFVGLVPTAIGIVFVVAGAGLSSAPALAMPPDPPYAVLLGVIGALLMLIGAGTMFAAALGLVFLRGFGVRGLLLAVAACAVVAGIWVGLVRPWLGGTFLANDGFIEFTFEPSMPAQHSSTSTTVFVTSQVTVGVPIAVLVAIPIVPLLVLAAILKCPVRSRQ